MLLRGVIRACAKRDVRLRRQVVGPLLMRDFAVTPTPIIMQSRYASSFESSTGTPWTKMTPQQRQAWELLGWNRHSWEGDVDPPPSDSCLWGELSPAQQAAAQHGLGYSPHAWDAELQGDDDHAENEHGELVCEEEEPTSSSLMSGGGNLPSRKTGGIGAVVGSLFQAVSLGASVVDKGFQVAHDPIGAVSDTFSGPPVVVREIESIVYLDDSVSMKSGQNLASAHAAYKAIAPALRETPTRVVMFGTGKSELVSRGSGSGSSGGSSSASGGKQLEQVPSGLVVATDHVTSQWQATSGGTYLWHMIYKDITARYQPGPGTLRVYVITDGEDMLSPVCESRFIFISGCVFVFAALESLLNHCDALSLLIWLIRHFDFAGSVHRHGRHEPFDEEPLGSRLQDRVVHRRGGHAPARPFRPHLPELVLRNWGLVSCAPARGERPVHETFGKGFCGPSQSSPQRRSPCSRTRCCGEPRLLRKAGKGGEEEAV